jgi:hypothetical protein
MDISIREFLILQTMKPDLSSINGQRDKPARIAGPLPLLGVDHERHVSFELQTRRQSTDTKGLGQAADVAAIRRRPVGHQKFPVKTLQGVTPEGRGPINLFSGRKAISFY